jgi:hypothetical protein
MKQVPYSGSTNIRRHRTKFSRHGYLTPGICAPLHKSLQPEVHLSNIENVVPTSQKTNRLIMFREIITTSSYKLLHAVCGQNYFFVC